jgi:hypothetical protein
MQIDDVVLRQSSNSIGQAAHGLLGFSYHPIAFAWRPEIPRSVENVVGFEHPFLPSLPIACAHKIFRNFHLKFRQVAQRSLSLNFESSLEPLELADAITLGVRPLSELPPPTPVKPSKHCIGVICGRYLQNRQTGRGQSDYDKQPSFYTWN